MEDFEIDKKENNPENSTENINLQTEADTGNNNLQMDADKENKKLVEVDTAGNVDTENNIEANNFYTVPYSNSSSDGSTQMKVEQNAQVNSGAGVQEAAATNEQESSPKDTQQSTVATAPAFYKENVKKTKTHKSNVFQLLLVAVMGSILGGVLVFAAIMFVAPAVQPSIQSLLNKSGITTISNAGVNTTGDNGIYKKIEITKSDSAVTAIAEKVSPSIVGIKVTATSQDFFLGQGESTGEGSGIIIKSDGYILTNYHVIESALSSGSNTLAQGAKIEVILPSEKEKSYTAAVVGKDTKSDLAVLKIDAGQALPAAELGDSSALKQGELAVAIGNPGGLDYMGSVTAGIISGLNRTITTEDGKTLTLIQTDAAINPGNSGGALCNSQGQVIGINTIKITATGFEGLGFAIPINHAKEVANNLITYKYIKGRPLIGIEIRQEIDAAAAKQYGVPEGILVGSVTTFGAADKAGIVQNDIITKFDGQAVNTYAKLEELKNKHKPGDKVSVEIYRYSDKSTKTLTITLDEDKS